VTTPLRSGATLSDLVRIDGTQHDGGQVLRTALVLSAATGQGFEVNAFRARQLRPGLQPSHLAVARAVAMACGARVQRAFEGSCELRFEPGALSPGDFEFDVTGGAAATFVVQSALAVLARCEAQSRIRVLGGTHLPHCPSFHYLARHWLSLAWHTGIDARMSLDKASFVARGAGEMRAETRPARPQEPLVLEQRGALLAVRGVCGAAGLKGDVARRMRDAAASLLWEERRLSCDWEVLDLPAVSAGTFAQMELVFERGQAAFDLLGQRTVRAETAGERLARRCLRFLDGEAVVDRFAADQLVVPMAVGGAGGRLVAETVTDQLFSVAAVTRLFGFDARVWGVRGIPGGVEVARS
jgi:RNA 3'-terminal phosphate cyclase (ATP)